MEEDDVLSQTDQETGAADAATDDLEAIWNEFAAEEAKSIAAAEADEEPPQGREPAVQGDEGEDASTREANRNAADRANNGEEAPGAKPTGRAPADEWASAPPELRPRIEALASERKRIGQDYAVARRQIGQLKAELAQLRSQVAASPSGAARDKNEQQRPSLLDDEDLKAVVGEYPEIAKPILIKGVGDLDQRLTRIEIAQQRVAQAEAENFVREQTMLLAEEHPDFAEVISQNRDSYLHWLQEQPRHVREAAERNAEIIQDAREASDVVARFKSHLGMERGRTANPPHQGQSNSLSGKRSRQLQATAAPRGRSVSALAGIPEDAPDEALWNAWRKKLGE